MHSSNSLDFNSEVVYLDDPVSLRKGLSHDEIKSYNKLKALVFQACYANNPRLLKKTVKPLSHNFQRFLLNSYHDEMTPLILSVCHKSNKIFNCLLDVNIFPTGIISLGKIGSVIIDANDHNSRVEGAPALWIAAALDRIEMVETLVARGANIEFGSLSGSTPLRCASYDGHIDVCKFLVSHGADLHAVNDCDQSPLMIGAAMGKLNVVEYLINSGARIGQATSQGDTALHITVEVACKEMVDLLIKSGAKNSPDNFGFTPLILSAAYRKVDNFNLLLDSCDIRLEELVNSLKILGAVFAMEEKVFVTKSYWRKAECVRVKTGTNLPDIAVSPLYEGVHEPNNAIELIRFDTSSSNSCFRGSQSFHLMIIALCIFERIFGSNHPHTAHYLRVCGDFFLQGSVGTDYQKCMDFWLKAFEYEKIRFGFEINAAIDLIISMDTFVDMFNSDFYPDIYPFVKWGVLELENPYTRITYLNNLLNVLSYFFSAWLAACNQFSVSHPIRVANDRERMGRLVGDILAVRRNVPLSLMHASLHNIKKLSGKITSNSLSLYKPVDNLKLFVKNGANINLRDSKTGDTLLHTAIANNCSVATVDTLLSLGIYPFLTNYLGNTAYQHMIELHSDVCQELKAHVTKIEKIGKSLKTLTVLTILRHEIPFDSIPVLLQEFVHLHTPRFDYIKCQRK